MSRQRQRQAGLALVEVMVSLLITSVIAIVLAGGFLVGVRTISTEARQISADQAVSGASLVLIRDLSSATTIGTGTISPGAGSLSVTFGSPAVTAIYRVDSGNNLTRTVGAAARVVSRGMQTLTLTRSAPACYVSVTLVPSATGAATVTLNAAQRVGSGGCL